MVTDPAFSSHPLPYYGKEMGREKHGRYERESRSDKRSGKRKNFTHINMKKKSYKTCCCTKSPIIQPPSLLAHLRNTIYISHGYIAHDPDRPILI